MTGDSGRIDTLVVRARLRMSRWVDAIVVAGWFVAVFGVGLVMMLQGTSEGFALGTGVAVVAASLQRRGKLLPTRSATIRLTPTRLEVGPHSSYLMDDVRGVDWEGTTLRVRLAVGSIDHHALPEDEAARSQLLEAVHRQLARRGERDEVPDDLGRLRAQVASIRTS